MLRNILALLLVTFGVGIAAQSPMPPYARGVGLRPTDTSLIGCTNAGYTGSGLCVRATSPTIVSPTLTGTTTGAVSAWSGVMTVSNNTGVDYNQLRLNRRTDNYSVIGINCSSGSSTAACLWNLSVTSANSILNFVNGSEATSASLTSAGKFTVPDTLVGAGLRSPDYNNTGAPASGSGTMILGTASPCASGTMIWIPFKSQGVAGFIPWCPAP